jgi:hypothetical protein
LEVPPSPSSFEPDLSSSATPSAHASPADREACRFLAEQVEPYLKRAQRPALAKAVHSAVAAERLEPLGRLAERQRRELLETIEERIESARTGPSPTALVRLTSVISAVALPDQQFGRRVASPAR